ncbi:MAG TPA: hypothetical protein VFQ23_01705 [Anaerolineales bacterium]|nr:hypothetical protein [Anaerolineales bacterium]
MNRKMNNKWKWIVSIAKAMIILLVPLLVLALVFQDSELLGMKTLFPAWLVMIAWAALIVFGFSEEG